MGVKGRKQPPSKLPERAPGEVGAEQEEGSEERLERVASGVKFQVGGRRGLYVGAQRLAEYLERIGLGWVVRMVQVLEEVDFSALYAAYKPGGRAPYHPRVMVGLVLYGVALGQWSLRQLELLAKRDVGAWWVCAGLQPDHCTLGRFVLKHEQWLRGEFFLEVTRRVLKRRGVKVGEVAADGTVVEAAAAVESLLQEARLEQLLAQAQEQLANEQPQPTDARPEPPQPPAQAQAQEQPANEQPQPTHAQPEPPQAQPPAQAQAQLPPTAAQAGSPPPAKAQAQRQLERLLEAQEVCKERQQAREKAGKDAQQVWVSLTEPQAMVQPRKDGVVRPSYKPSVLVNSERFILGQVLHPSSETQCVQPLLIQHGQLLGALPTRALFDASYHTREVLLLEQQTGMEVLCPAGKAKAAEDCQKKGHKGRLPKSAFRYEAATDSYTCPAGARLSPGAAQKDSAGRTYRQYRTRACAQCPLRSQCTQGKQGRRLKRYEGDELKEAMARRFNQPAVRASYRRRSGMVEPVFADLKERQGLRRFHRCGLLKAALEFALHCTAYNLRRAVRCGQPLLLLLFARLPSGPWRLVGLALLLYAP